MLPSIMFTLLGVVLGAFPSWYFSRMYYLKSGTDLDAALQPLTGDSQKLLRGLNAVGRMLEQAGIGRPTYDEAGNITGVVIFGKADITLGGLKCSASGYCIPPPPDESQHEQPSPEAQRSHDV